MSENEKIKYINWVYAVSKINSFENCVLLNLIKISMADEKYTKNSSLIAL